MLALIMSLDFLIDFIINQMSNCNNYIFIIFLTFICRYSLVPEAFPCSCCFLMFFKTLAFSSINIAFIVSRFFLVSFSQMYCCPTNNFVVIASN